MKKAYLAGPIKQQSIHEAVVAAVGKRLSDGGIRVVTIAALYDLVQREARKQGQLGPGWSALVDTLERLDGYEVSGFEGYTVTLPGPGRMENLSTVVRRVTDGIAAWRGDGSPEWDAENVISWVEKQLGDTVPEQKEATCCEEESGSSGG